MIIKAMTTIATPQAFIPSTGALRLSDWGLIRAEGPEAAKFLHGQLTQDFELLKEDQARLAGFCSAKGRLLANLIGWKAGPETIYLALPLELLPTILKRLSMFVLRAKCKLSDATAEQSLWGVLGELPEQAGPSVRWGKQVTATGATLIRLPDSGADASASSPRYLLAQASDAAAPALPALDAADWQWLQVQSGLAWVGSATAEAFVPQMINLELLDGVNFKKGCYPGQEVVARSQYRGTLKRRTHLFELADSAADAKPGQEIFHSLDPEQPAGLVANVASRAGHSLLLAEVKIAALEEGTLHLGSASGPLLTHRALPYEIPLNSEV